MTPEERRKIYEEEKARIEAGAPPIIPSAKKEAGPGTLLFVAIVIVVGIYYVYYSNVAPPERTVADVVTAAKKGPPAAPASPTSQLHLLSARGTIEHGFAKVNGQVKNVTSKPLENVAANVSWYTKSGEFVKSDDALIDYNPLLPGQTSPFEVLTSMNPEMTKFTTEFKFLLRGAIKTEDLSKKKITQRGSVDKEQRQN